MAGLTHFDAAGAAQMVDVSGKPDTARLAIARGWVAMRPETLALVTEGTAAKGDVLGVARLAGIMAAKRTADLIPLCHPLALSKVTVDLAPDAPAAVHNTILWGNTNGAATDQDAQSAIQAMNGVTLDGRALRVNEAEERAPRSGGGGGGHRGGGGGGGRRDRW